MGFEPTCDGFANHCLTAWLPHRVFVLRGVAAWGDPFRNSFFRGGPKAREDYSLEPDGQPLLVPSRRLGVSRSIPRARPGLTPKPLGLPLPASGTAVSSGSRPVWTAPPRLNR